MMASPANPAQLKALKGGQLALTLPTSKHADDMGVTHLCRVLRAMLERGVLRLGEGLSWHQATIVISVCLGSVSNA